MTEPDQAIILANKILDRVNADPDDDIAILARQFLRSIEKRCTQCGWPVATQFKAVFE